MTKQLQFRRYANTTLGTVTGLQGELIVDLTKRTLTIHDGLTPGGNPLATEGYVNTLIGPYATVVSGSYTASLSSSNGTFSVPGNITLPNGTTLWYQSGASTELTANINNDTSGLYIEDPTYSSGLTVLYGNTNVLIQADAGNTAPTWTFNNDRTLKFPDGSIQTTAYNSSGTSVDNTARSIANSAGIYANGAFIQANASFILANTISSNTANLFGISLTQNNSISAAFIQANGAFIQANAAFAAANNIAPIILPTSNTANAAFIQANLAFTEANSAAIYANGSFIQSNSSFGVANSASIYANGAFIQANASFALANTISSNTVNLFGIELTQNTNIQTAFAVANSASIYANGAFTEANAAYQSQNTTGGYANSAFSAANSAGVYANGAFTQANTKVSKSGDTMTGTLYLNTGSTLSLNTTGSIVVGGDINLTGNLNLSGTVNTYTANSVSISDPIIYLAANNSADVVDIGFVGHFIGVGNTGYSHYQHTGLVRDYNDRKWKLFSNVISEPTTTVVFDANTSYDTLKVGVIEAGSANINGVDMLSFASGAYTTANSAGVYANGAFIQANASFTLANTISSNTANLFGIELTQNNSISAAFIQANAAFNKANTGGSSSSSGYLANSIIFANTTGYLSNTSNLDFYTSNNTLAVSGQITANYIGFGGSQAIVATFSGANSKGGTGYSDFLQATNLSGGATYPNKYFRLDSNGQFQIINSAYSQNIFNLNDTGVLSVPYFQNLTLLQGGGGQITFADGTTQATAASGAAIDQTARNSANAASIQANAAFIQANASFILANTISSNTANLFGISLTQNNSISAAFIQANGAFIQANAVFTLANTISSNTANLFGISLTQNNSISAAFIQANGAFTEANAAYQSQNTTGGYANSAYAQANGASIYANGAFIQANASFALANTISSNTANLFGIELTQNTNITSAATYANGAFIQSNSSFGVANSASIYANGAFIQANAVFTLANTISSNTANLFGISLTQNTNITSASAYANGAFNAANSAGVYANGAFTSSNSKFSSAGGTITGNTTIQGSLTVYGNINFTGNVINTTVTGNSGQFFGNTAGFGALYTGITLGYLIEPQIVTQVTANYNGYAGGINIQNINTGANASGDLFISADNGTLFDGFLDLGLASSTYNYTGYTLIGRNDGYWIVTGNTNTGGGNMIMSTGYNNDIIFAQGGTNTNNEVARFKYNTGLVFKSNGITFADNTLQNTAAAPFAYTNAAFIQANAAFIQANLAFTEANSAAIYANGSFIQSNSSFGVANSASIYANGAFIQANASFTLANTISSNTANLFGISLTQNNSISAAFIQANAAFNKANTGGFSGGSIPNALTIANTTASTSNGTGALIVTGGAGITGNIYTNAVYANGLFYASNNQPWITGGGGGGSFNGGTITNTLTIANTTTSNSNTTGALVVNGSIGVASNVYVGFGGVMGFANTTTGVSAAYTFYNPTYGSLDTVFG